MKINLYFALIFILLQMHLPIFGQQVQKQIQVSSLIGDTLDAREPETSSPSRSAIYVELLGQGILYSINYDYLLTDHLSLRAGFSTWSLPAFALVVVGEVSVTSFPLMLNYLVGDGSSHLELGVGIIPMYGSFAGQEIFFGTDVSSGQKTVILGTATLGYRLQPRSGGFVFRAGLTPFIGSGGAKLSGGLSLGWSF